MRLSLNQKLSLGIVALVIGLVATMMTIANISITRAIERKTQEDLLAARTVFEEFQSLRFEGLLTITKMVADIPQLKAVVTTEDLSYATILDSAKWAQQLIGSDLFMLSDAEGRLLASVTEPERVGIDLSGEPAFASALRGEPFGDVWVTDQGIFQIVAAPLYFGDEVEGAVLAGFASDPELIKTLERMTNGQVALMGPEILVGSRAYDQLFRPLMQERSRLGEDRESHLSSTVFDGERYVVWTDTFGTEASYALARSLDQQLSFFHDLQRALLFSSGAILVIALLLGILHSRRITQPIGALVAWTKRIAAGDLSSQVAISSSDELGELARSFNQMGNDVRRLMQQEKQHATESANAAFTERRRAEELQIVNQKMEQANVDLQNEIAERKRAEGELHTTNVELTRSNAELEQFAYVASHDLKEPLRMVTNYTQLLAKRYDGKLDESADEFIGFIVHGVKRMAGLIEDLLAFSRVTREATRIEPIDCAKIVEVARNNLVLAIQETGAVVTSQDLPTVMGDATLLGQLFQNLIDNAVKFRKKDEPPRVAISAQRKDDTWVFAVRDNGIGLEQQYAERIFVIFQRLEAGNESPGTGIGLAICKKIVEHHDGRIWVESTLGQGSTFYFTLPATLTPGKREGQA